MDADDPSAVEREKMLALIHRQMDGLNRANYLLKAQAMALTFLQNLVIVLGILLVITLFVLIGQI